MPAFTFEKLTPPAPPGPATPDLKKRRGFVGQMLDRLTARRARPLSHQEKAAIAPGASPTQNQP